jgi:protein-L-isoaspartate(D-aspartate) O-methyltransferase
MSPADQAEIKMSFLLTLRERGIRNTNLLRAFEKINRSKFVGHLYADLAREDISLPIGCGQSQTAPSDLALMLDALQVSAEHRVLDIGTGSGYASAIMSWITQSVVTVDRYKSLTLEAAARFQAFGIENISSHHGDGRHGLSAHGPFDRIFVDGAFASDPLELLAQLQPNGILVGIKRAERSELVRYKKVKSRFEQQVIAPMSAPLLQAGVAIAM